MGGFKCQYFYWSEKKQKWRKDDEEEPIKVKHVDTVFMCTGYNENLEMLDESLRFDTDKTWELSKNWEMVNNAYTLSVGDVTPSKSLFGGGTVFIDVYRCLLISNPKVMFINESEDTDYDLLQIDVNAWLVLRYLTGELEIPKEKDMIKENTKQLKEEMNIPWLRQGMDRAYLAELEDLDDGHWSENPDDERCLRMEQQVNEFKAKILARDAKAAKYPLDLRKADKFKQFLDLMVAANRVRSMMNKDSNETYRDVHHPAFKSLYTNTPSCALPDHWIKLKSDYRV